MGMSGPVLPGLAGRLFRGAPLLTWLTAWAWHDLRQPDSRIKALASRLKGIARREPGYVVSVMPPAGLEGPGRRVLQNGGGEQKDRREPE